MIKFKGKNSLKQYNQMKPIKIGYKIWCLSDNDGYIHSIFQVYVDKTNEKENNKFGLGGRVVVDLTKHLEGKCHEVYFDNFFPQCHFLSIFTAMEFLFVALLDQTEKVYLN